MLSSSSFVVKKEHSRKVISLVSETKDSLSEPKVKGQNTAGLIRRQEVARCILRHFRAFPNQKTVSVFGAKDIATEEIRLLSLVAKRVFSFDLYFIGVIESADSGPHGHFIAFKEVAGVPSPLTPEEEKHLCIVFVKHLWSWRNRNNKSLRPSRFLLRKMRSPPEKDLLKSRSFYRVPRISYGGVTQTSGIGHYALSYSLKSMLVLSKSKAFIASTGLAKVIKYVKSKQETRIKVRRLWNKSHSTYRFPLLSILAFEAEKQLRYLDPKQVSVHIKYGRVFVDTNGQLKLWRNNYLLIGLELLRRDLQDFSSASPLRRATSKVCKSLCSDLRCFSTEHLHELAKNERNEIVFASQRKKTI